VETKAHKTLQQIVSSGQETVTSLARKVGVSQPSASAWMLKRSRPEPHHRTVIRMLFGIPESDWLTDDECAVIHRAEQAIAESTQAA